MNLDRARSLLARLSIKHRDLNVNVPFVFNPNQLIAHNMVRKFYAQHGNIRAIILKARRVGQSSYWDSILFCHALARPQAHAEIVAHLKDVSTKGLFRVPRDLASELNVKVGGEPCEIFAQQIKFHHQDGDSLLDIATAGSVGGGRGLTLTALHLSEAALYPGQDSFLSILPAVSKAPDTIIAIESTAQGRTGIGQTFFDHWTSAKKVGRQWNGYLPIFLSWLDDPACWSDSPAEDAPATDLERELMKSFGATREQIAWMRFVLEGECAASEAKFSQEYPWCLVENTRVSTNRGIIPIAQVKIGEVSESGDVVGAGVVFRNELVATITTESGRQITGTYDHPMETTDGRFVRLDESCGEVLKLRPPRFADEPYTERWGWDCGVLSELPINESYARFLGYFMGDGCYHGGIVSIVCYGKDVDVVEDVSSLMNLIFGYCGRRQTGVKKGCTEVRVTRAKFAEVMQRLGIWNSEDKPHRKVCVPECIFRSPKIIVREFLKGLFEADGFNAFHCRRVVLYSKHIEFLRDVQLLLLGFGITSRVKSRETHNKTYKYTARTLELRTEEAIRFNEQIGFISARKTARFVPSTKKHRPRNPIVMEDKVISVELAGRANVYDLTIEKNHTFSANGLVSHNTPEVAFTSTGDPAFAPAEIKYAYRTRRERPLFKGTFYRDSGTVKLREDPKGKWFIYERTIPKCHYYVGVDCARGMEFETGRATGDFSAIGIVNGTTGDAAAKFSEWVDPDMIANEVDMAGRYYNQAKVNVELTGNLGWMAQKRLRDDFLYPNFYIWKGKDDKQVGKQQSHALGWETQGRSRDILYQALRGKLRDGMKNIPGGFAPIDPELIEQMDVATLSTGGRWEVEKGHDDVLVCFMLAVVACVQYPPPMVWPSSHNVYETPKEKTDSVAASLKASPDLTHALQRDLRYVFRKERKQVRAVQGGY